MTVRIDTLRNQLTATGSLLRVVRLHVDDLHHVAYERHANGGSDPKVRGGSRDYALDTHGSPDARDALRAVSDQIATSCEDIAVVLHHAASQLKKGDSRGNQSRRLVTLAEHAEAIAAAAVRAGRGEGTERFVPQPGRDQAIADLEGRASRAEKKAVRLQRKLDKALARIEQLRPRDRVLAELRAQREHAS